MMFMTEAYRGAKCEVKAGKRLGLSSALGVANLRAPSSQPTYLFPSFWFYRLLRLQHAP